MPRFDWFTLLFMLGASCATPTAGPRVVLVLLDDIGIDKLASYSPDTATARTPTLDGLAEQGVRFETAYAFPTCSPSRAAMLTGRYGRRYGIGFRIAAGSDDAVPDGEAMLPDLLRHADPPWRSAFVGKWHLVGREAERPLHHPNRAGFDHFAGSLFNLNRETEGNAEGYYDWERVENGRATFDDRYATTVTVDDAIERLERDDAPNLLVVSFHAAHTPYDVPPSELVQGPVGGEPTEVVDQMIEAMDTELHRLLAAVDDHAPESTLIVVGDNGTSSKALDDTQTERHKGSTYEAGVRVPLLVSGPVVTRPGSVSHELAHVADMAPTILEMAGLRPDRMRDVDGQPLELDGRSLLPWIVDSDAPLERFVLFSEQFAPNHQRTPRQVQQTLRTHQYKLRVTDDRTSLYAIGTALDEGPDLLDRIRVAPRHQAIANELLDRLDALLEEVEYDAGVL